MKEANIYRPALDYSANESYKSLRTNLLFCGEEKKVIAITSCTPWKKRMKEKVLCL